MLKLSKMTDYGIVVLSILAQREEGSLASARDISEATRLPQPTVAKVLKVLSRKGIVESVRGAAGGYRLAVQPDGLDLVTIIEALEGPVRMTSCAVAPFVCPDDYDCPVGQRWPQINDAVVRALSEVSLSDLAGNTPSAPAAGTVACGPAVGTPLASQE